MEELVKKLASSDGVIRDKAFKALRNHILSSCSSLAYRDYLRLWKAFFYALWMADRPTYQRDLAQMMGDMWGEIDRLDRDAGKKFVEAFWETICREWPGIDKHRLDKFYNLLRRFLYGHLERCQSANWDPNAIRFFNHPLQSFPLHPTRSDIPDALRMYSGENMVELLGIALSTTNNKLDGPMTEALLEPYVEMCRMNQKSAVLKIFSDMFSSLLTPSSSSSDASDALASDNLAEGSFASEQQTQTNCPPQIDQIALKKILFEAGAKSETPDKNRKVLYAFRINEIQRSNDSNINVFIGPEK